MRNRDLGFWVSVAGIAGAIFGLCQVLVAVGAWLFPVTSTLPPNNAPDTSLSRTPQPNTPQSELSVPFLSIFENFLEQLPVDTWPWLLTVIGITLIVFGVWLIFRSRDEDFYNNYSVFLGIIGFAAGIFAGYQMWQGWGVVVGFFILGPVFMGLFLFTRLSGGVLGMVIGAIIGCGVSFLYLAIPGPFISGWVVVGTLIGAILGMLAGFLFKKP